MTANKKNIECVMIANIENSVEFISIIKITMSSTNMYPIAKSLDFLAKLLENEKS